MTVVWRQKLGRLWRDVGLAVPCPTCNVEQGKPCEPAGNGCHEFRRVIAMTLGFSLVAEAPLLEPQEKNKCET